MSEFENEVFLHGVGPNDESEMDKSYEEEEDEDEYAEFREDFDDD